jgi:cell wall-associated NlpC family hydrolase
VSAASLAELLQNPRLAMPADARTLFASGTVDPRLVGVLTNTLQHHTIVIGDMENITDPVHAQAIDITAVDGQPIDPSNVAARDLITEIAALDPSTRPSEIGTPWPIQSQGFFTDPTHQNRLHLAFTSPADYTPPATATAGTTGAAASGTLPGPAPSDPAAAGVAQAAQQAMAAPPTPAPVPAVAAQVAGTPATPGTAAVPEAPVVPETAGGQQPGVAGQAVDVAQQLSPQGGGAAGPKVQAMTTMANSLLGKPYILGGGHGSWAPQPGYDCSGFVSNVLHAGGYLSAPVDTTALPSQPGILSGPGHYVTIYDRALPGENGHVIIDINGQFYESGGMHGPWGGGGGVEKIGRPSDSYLATFEHVLHPAGL